NGHEKGVRDFQLPGIHQVVADNAAQSRITFSCEFQIRLRERASVRLVGMAIPHAETVFQDDIKRRSTCFRYVQTNNHAFVARASRPCELKSAQPRRPCHYPQKSRPASTKKINASAAI